MSSYLLRLLCLCFASFFVLNAALTALVRAGSKFALAFCAKRSPRAAAHFLFALRVLPAAVAALFVLLLCVPSYLWLEPAITGEQVGVLCGLCGILAIAALSLSVTHSARALLASVRFNRFCVSRAHDLHVSGQDSPVLVVENEAPILAMSGLLRPRLLISRGILETLGPEEMDAALRHERAHCVSRDNLKRLAFSLTPDVLPFTNSLRTLEQHWSRYTEWAADDRAAAGDSQRALSLASALLRVARLGAAPNLPLLSTSLLACDHDLSARVARLLRPAPGRQPHSAPRASILAASAVFAAAVVAALAYSPAALASIHNLLERFLH